MSLVRILDAGPLLSIQDRGRWGALGYGIAASGPMDRAGFVRAGKLIATQSQTALESAGGRLVFELKGGAARAGFSGGEFNLRVNGEQKPWNSACELKADELVEITPGKTGTYAYVRFDGELDVPVVVGSRATNTVARLGGLDGALLVAGDEIALVAAKGENPGPGAVFGSAGANTPVRFVWGVHADLFAARLRRDFVSRELVVSPRLDRMGVRLFDPGGIFSRHEILSLVSEAVVPGDMQILGDGTPIVLMRDHQPTGGYPRIATVISADLDRFAQLRPGTGVRFLPVSVDHAHKILREARTK